MKYLLIAMRFELVAHELLLAILKDDGNVYLNLLNL